LVLFSNTKIDYETRSYSFLSKENLKNLAFMKLNPSGDLPFMEAEKNIQGAHTILRYLCNTRLQKDNHLYPSNPVSRAKVDMMIDWHVTTLQICSKSVWSDVLKERFPEFFGILVTPVK